MRSDITCKPIQICASEDIEQAVLQIHPNMAVHDSRPYQTLARYLKWNHLALAVYEGGSFGLVKANTTVWLGSILSFGAILDKAARWSLCAQSAAKTSFERMCAEEDYEEFCLLKERWEKGGKRRYHAHQHPLEPVKISQDEVERGRIDPLIKRIADETSALYQGVDTDDLLANF